ncbi:hypothetical protein ACFC6L_19780 [Kitasatospora phosalacinea]|uniref:hypothetical protein n=1 Tax=Kitasatospora phosalacinea TaxID=2065 RepID=UPI0035E2BE27
MSGRSGRSGRNWTRHGVGRRTTGPWTYDCVPLGHRAGTVADARRTADGSGVRFGADYHAPARAAGPGRPLLTGATPTGSATTPLGALAAGSLPHMLA